MPKVSVVMPVYNASRFLNDSMNSILNQTLDDLELICVDDGSTDESLDILNNFKDNDSRVKVFSLKHQGGGNARNYGLENITGEYLFCMDADDILDLNAFEDFYKIAQEKKLDFLVFKAINYGVEKDHYFETEYQNMTGIYNKVKDNVFSYKDLGNLLFDFNVSPWCKFYNADFIKSTKARFRENSKFHDNNFFWGIIFKAKRIYFINEFYYTRKRYDQSLTASGDSGHSDMIDVTNDIIAIFKKQGKLEIYKRQLFNLKITWITDRYNQVKDNNSKEEFLSKMKKDYKRFAQTELLDNTHVFILNSVLYSKDSNEFDKLKRYYQIFNENKSFNDKISKYKDWFEGLNEDLQNFSLKTLQTNFKSENKNQLNDEQLEFYHNILNSKNGFNYRVNKKITRLKIDFENYKQNPDSANFENRLNELLNEYDNDSTILGELKKDDAALKSIIKDKTAEIDHLKSQNIYLSKKYDHMTEKSENESLIKKLFSRN
ncbi:glycosyltransferase family 2 protein [Methanobrevibacter sp.]|uniref:glycosyltransferase family 2 protein n=1 Tax=Methanobrevibacter sp. TaxID=66852 RepID=UPI0038666E99